MNSSTRPASAPTLLASFSVFLFSALALVVPTGQSYGAALLLLPALAYLLVRPYPNLNSPDKYLVATLLAYFIVGASSNWFHHLSSSSYEKPARFLFAIPVLLFLLRFPVRPIYFWSGIASGALGAGVLSAWNFWAQGAERAAGNTHPIQFGDIAILFSCLLLSAIPLARHCSRWILALFLVGIAGGVLASLLSGARGGWLARPAAAFLLYVAARNYSNARRNGMLLAAFILPVIAITQLPQDTFLQSRINVVFVDIKRFHDDNDVSTSLGARLHLWQRSVQMIALRPMSGWGTLERVGGYLDSRGTHDEVVAKYKHVHNEVLDSVLKRGIAGGLALLALYFIPAILFYRQWCQALPSEKCLPLAGLTLVMCTMIFGLTQSFFSHTNGVMVYAFTVVILWAQTRNQSATTDPH